MIGTLPSGTKLTLDADPLIEEKRIAGCYLGAASPERDVPALVERYLSGELQLDELVSRRIALAELDDGFARLREGTEARQVVVFTHRERSGMSTDPMDHPASDDATGLTRAELLRRAAGGAVLLSAGGLIAACGSSGSSGSASSATSSSAATGAAKSGGHLRIGATGGGAKDSIDAHSATADTDIVRISALFEPLAQPSADFKTIEMVLAESVEPLNGDAGVWDIRLRSGVEFHNGKTLSADDVIYSLKRITDPKNPLTGAASIGYINRNGIKKMDALTVRVPLTIKNSAFLADVGQYFNGIVPVGYDPKAPVSTAAWKFQSFTPGQQSVFVKNPNYWQKGKPLADQLTIIDFTDDTARVNALLSGQIDLADTVPTEQITQIQGNSSLTLLNNPSGVWLPITMRVDQAPFNDVRVRPGLPAHGQPAADGGAGAERAGLGRERPIRAFRPGLRQFAAPASAGPRAGEVAAQAGGSRRPEDHPGDRAGVRRHPRGGPGLCRDGERRGGHREPQQDRLGHVLRR